MYEITHRAGQPPQGPPRAPQRRPRRRRPYLAAAAVVTLVIGAAAAWSLAADRTAAAPPPTATINGVLILKGAFTGKVGATKCSGSGGYSDITAGAQVVVYDPGGTTIATGALETGKPAALSDMGGLLSKQVAGECQFAFSVSGIPEQTFYGVQVSHRGRMTYSAEQVGGMWITMTLGSS